MVSAYEEELESDVFGCCGEGAGVVEVPGIIGSWHANITKTIPRLFRYFRFDFNLIYSVPCFLICISFFQCKITAQKNKR